MSDNIIDPEIWRLYVLFMSIPNETWTDVLKLLSRRILVQKISPVCKRLKNISNRNVDNVHVINKAAAVRFNVKLRRGDPEADQQLEHLAANDCPLASQFRLTRIRIIPENMAIFRHCIELFRGCRLSLQPNRGRDNVTFVNECLTTLESAKPTTIYIRLNSDPHFLFNQFLRHPTIWNCNRIKLMLPFPSADAIMPLAMAFLDWLHHQQSAGVDGSGDGVEQEGKVHCLIIKCIYKMVQEAIDIDCLINGCIQNFKQSRDRKDRRRFVLSFSAWNRDETTRSLNQFERHHNQATGEILLLERADAANQIATVYRLRRCLAEEAANGDEFYAKTFKRDDLWDEFVVSGDGLRGRIDYR